MPLLEELIPDSETLIALAPEELAQTLLQIFGSIAQNGMVNVANFTVANQYRRHGANDVSIALREAWQWMILNFLIMPAEGTNGNHGWMVLTRKGMQLSQGGDFRSFREAVAFPKALLHPMIADKVWLNLARGDL